MDHISTLNLTRHVIPVIQQLGGLKAVARAAGCTLQSYDFARNSKIELLTVLAAYACRTADQGQALNKALTAVCGVSSYDYDWSNVPTQAKTWTMPGTLNGHKTYPVRDQLTALAARWDAATKLWVFASESAYNQAHYIVTGQPPSGAAAAKNSNASAGKGSSEYQGTDADSEAQTAPADAPDSDSDSEGQAPDSTGGVSQDETDDDDTETDDERYARLSAADDDEIPPQDDDMDDDTEGPAQDDLDPVAQALQQLQEAMKQRAEAQKAPPSIDEDRVREIAREEATTLDSTMQDNILAAVESAAKAALDLTPREVKTVISINSLPDVDASEMHPQTPLIAALVGAGLNVYMHGLPGSGKTHAAQNVAKLLDRRFVGSLSLSGGITEAALLGMGVPLGEGRYVGTPTMDCYENGGIMLWDEFPAADPNTMMAANQLSANDYVTIERRLFGGLDPVVKKHSLCGFVAAGNNVGQGGGQFVGTNKQDPSALDRWFMVHLGYDSAYEARLCGESIPNVLWSPAEPLQDGEAPLWRQWVQAIRATLENKKSKRFFSTRALQKALAARSIGMRPAEIVDSLFAGWTADDITSLGSHAAGPAGL
jgi:hypothetical protein